MISIFVNSPLYSCCVDVRPLIVVTNRRPSERMSDRNQGIRRSCDLMPRVDPDDERFAAWYEAERDRMVRAIAMITTDVDTAREVVAEAFTRAYERWGRVGEMASPT